ncbi:N-acetylneuraminate synthase [Fuscovulum ytuae]|uniref:N-acetylneuraminate synthase n=1 Tax=Fuscovulum ytuae TaxID=3042299 RepID=A0ABY8QCW6_9RHOB|nr:N-acetylneuraminate synthase [Fuscovulum sp. YMD61]WGV18117.1 N-acetylneuraminate synthase [Fuscovulum sp. YMD61]
MAVPYATLGPRRVSAEDPCYIIAEIGVNHNGDVNLAHRMIDAAKLAGADAVKFQTFRTDDLVTASAQKADYQTETTGRGSQAEMLRRLELPTEAFAALHRHCKTVGIDFMSTAFDAHSLETVIALGPACLKWPSGELNNLPLLRLAARSGLPVMLSTGMGSVTEISVAVDQLAKSGCDDIIILQCVSNYPARIEEQNLRVIPALSAVFGRPVGFSDHTIGPFAAIAARALGMAVLEKHFTLDRALEGPDHAASIEPDQFAEMVSVIRAVEAGLGDGVKRAVASEEGVRAVARKSLVFCRALPQGHVLSEDDLVAKRPGTGISPDRLEVFLGLALKRGVEKDEMLVMDHVR